MLRMFSFLPPIACYALSMVALVATYMAQMVMIENAGSADTRIYVVGGILAFLLAFAGFQRSVEQREEAKRPRVSSHDVMQKLTPTETARPDAELDVPPTDIHGPSEDSPLGRVRARSEAQGA